MGKDSKIAWTHHTFNPWVGCQRVSPGCVHCYAEAYDARVGGVPKKQRANPEVAESRWGPSGRRTRTSASNWAEPLKWNRAAEKAGQRCRVFCSSLADVFEDRPELEPWRNDLWHLIKATPHLDWLLLTKRPHNISAMMPAAWIAPHGLDVQPNVWLGATVEDQQRANERIPELLSVPAKVRFLSCEPLLERIDITSWLAPESLGRSNIDWVIIGGESGPGARPFNVAWARSLVDQCRGAGAAPFVKQLGANVRTRNDDHLVSDFDEGGWCLDPREVEENVHGFREDHQGAEVRVRLRDSAGGDPNEWPIDLRVREFP